MFKTVFKECALFGNLFLAFLLFTVGVSAQVTQPVDRPEGPPPDGQAIRQPNLLRELGLTQPQIRQLRLLNVEGRPLMQEAQRKLREANRELDLAIYADNMQESEVAEKLRAFQLAQAEVAKLRFQGELAIRRILTPEQLVKFRELRARFGQMRENMQQRRGNRPAQPRDGVPGPKRPQDPPSL